MNLYLSLPRIFANFDNKSSEAVKDKVEEQYRLAKKKQKKLGTKYYVWVQVSRNLRNISFFVLDCN